MRSRLFGVVVVALALTASACGSRLPADVLAQSDGRLVSAAGAASSGPAAGTATAAAGGDVAASASGAPAQALAGAQAATPGSAGSTATKQAGAGTAAPGKSQTAVTAAPAVSASGTAACVAGSGTEKGVTQKELKFASIVTASGPLPGATEGSYRGAAAYFAMINSQGGVCGRKLTLVKGDDALDPARARSEFLRLEPQVLAFTGSYAVADSGYIDLIKGSGVPHISSTIDPAGREVRSVVPKAPEGVVSTGPFVYYKKQYPNVSKVGYLLADIGGVAANSPGTERALERSGYTLAYRSAAKVTDPDYTSHVIRMRNEGVDFLYLFAFEINMQVRMARNMRQQNWDPQLKMNLIGYNTKWYDTMGADANGWKSYVTYLPMLNPDEPASSPALATFIDWNKRLFPKDQLDLFPVSGWTNAAYLVEALRKVGPDVTRAKLLDALYAVPQIDGNGMSPPVKPVGGEANLCFIAVKAEAGRWQREAPAAGFECGLGERFKFK